MSGDIVTAVLMPMALAFIMVTLGIGVERADFARIARRPLALALGAIAHFILLPSVCFLLITLFGLGGEVAVGMMIIAACPTGTTSNLLTRIARGDVALAISFTTIASIVTAFTLPFIAQAAMAHYLSATETIAFPLGYMVRQILLLLALPVGLGMAFRAWRPRLAIAVEPAAAHIATFCFVLIVIAALARNWTILSTHFLELAPIVIALNLIMLGCGYGLAKWGRLETRQAVTLAIESAMQNATLAIVIGTSVLHRDALAVPGAVYGILMYASGLVFAFAMRRWLATHAGQSSAELAEYPA